MIDVEQTYVKNPLKYGYELPPALFTAVIGGTLVRAIGKNWVVAVTSIDQDKLTPWERLSELLVDPSQLLLYKVTKLPVNIDANLVIGEGMSDQRRAILRAQSKSNHQHVVLIDPDANYDNYDLISLFSIFKRRFDTARATAIIGLGKGKTTTALGMALEAVLQGKSVKIVQWFKERNTGDLTWAINEHFFPAKLKKPELMEFYPMGLGFFGSPNMDRVKGEQAYAQHRAKAYEGLELAKKLVFETKPAVIVLDELLDTVAEIARNIEYPLIELDSLKIFLAEITSQNHTEVVVTGRRTIPEIVKWFKQSITIDQVKHPWDDAHQGAVSGLDY